MLEHSVWPLSVTLTWNLGTCQKLPQDERACSVSGSELEDCDRGHGDTEPCPTTHLRRGVTTEHKIRVHDSNILRHEQAQGFTGTVIDGFDGVQSDC